jgi:peptide/nickel transport system permease protein
MATATKTLAQALDKPPSSRSQEISLQRLAWRRFTRHRLAMVGLLMIALLLVFVLGGAFIFSETYANLVNLGLRLHAPSLAHPWGTDAVGRDILARAVYGGQVSLLIGAAAVLVALLVGVTVGALSGYYGGWLDSVLMRFTEAMLNIPQLFLLIIAAKFLSNKMPDFHFAGRQFSGSVVVIIAIIGLDSWMYLARIVRSQFLALKEREFITAARCVGTPNARIIVRHILPNTVAPIIVTATLGVANAILTEAYISFLGLGVRPPTATWGNMLEDANRYLETAPWLWFFPGMLILLTVLGINFAGDGLRDALDPRSLTE